MIWITGMRQCCSSMTTPWIKSDAGQKSISEDTHINSLARNVNLRCQGGQSIRLPVRGANCMGFGPPNLAQPTIVGPRHFRIRFGSGLGQIFKNQVGLAQDSRPTRPKPDLELDWGYIFFIFFKFFCCWSYWYGTCHCLLTHSHFSVVALSFTVPPLGFQVQGSPLNPSVLSPAANCHFVVLFLPQYKGFPLYLVYILSI